MTFSDILTMLGAGAGILILLTVAAAPLLADLSPVPRRRAEPSEPTAPAPSARIGVPAPRSPSPAEGVRGMLAEHAAARHATAG